ncbi:MAG: flagellar motor switch protein FliG [Gammaproteobacteria bacterium]|nr:flagellar motor switch protein FliG [Gammaproteobacteria bacterium]
MAADAGRSRLQGPEKAAVLLMSLGEQAAASVLKHMGPKEVQRIGVAMAGLQNVSKDTVRATIDEFVGNVQQQTGLGVGSEDYIRNVLTDALGEDKARGMVDRILLGGNTKGLESLKWMDPRAVAEIIRLEHPQVIAIVLSYLDSDQAGAVLSEFPAKTRGDILLRIATMDGVQPAAMTELNDMLENQIKVGSNVKSSPLGGVKTAASILNFVDNSIESEIMEQIKEVDTELGQRIHDLMFVFDDLTAIDDRGIQTLLREISTDSLVLALKGADEGIKEKVFKNMSSRAAEMLRDDLDTKGPVRLSEVEGAQKEILAIARRLGDEGRIVLGGGGEDMVG